MRYCVLALVVVCGCQYAARSFGGDQPDPDAVCETSTSCSVCYRGTRLVSSTCPSSTSCADVRGGMCQECRDNDGNLVSTNCPIDCGLCVAPTCDAGKTLVTLSGQCCPVCLPTTACDAISCNVEQTMTCPAGQHAERNPADCCSQMCVVDSCADTCSAAQESACPSGYVLDPDVAPCCGVCVPEVKGACAASSDCPADQTCVSGVCTADVSCTAIALPDPTLCEGFWRIDADAQGCPSNPVCYCDNLLPSTDGTCPDTCFDGNTSSCTAVECTNPAISRNPCDSCCTPATAVCTPPPRACRHASDCDGNACVDGYCTVAYNGTLIEGVVHTLDGILSGLLGGGNNPDGVSYNGGNLCTQVAQCTEHQAIDFGAGCCPTCRDLCKTDADCVSGQTCQRDPLSQCAVPACQLGSCSGTMEACYGVCE